MNFIYREALNSDVNNFSWCMLVCGHMEKSLDILTNEFNFDEREIILEKFVMAKTLWACRKCVTNEHTDSAAGPNIIELVLSGYIECRLCRHWFHRMCCAESIPNFDDASFVCESCTAMFVIQVQTDPYAEVTQPDGLTHHIKKVSFLRVFVYNLSNLVN